MAGMGVLEGVAQSLARDAVNLIPYDGVQVPYGTLHRQIECCSVAIREFVADRLQGLGKSFVAVADERKS